MGIESIGYFQIPCYEVLQDSTVEAIAFRKGFAKCNIRATADVGQQDISVVRGKEIPTQRSSDLCQSRQ